jgi:uncharacterized surface protein with fasciclin (FAS1) repeats
MIQIVAGCPVCPPLRMPALTFRQSIHVTCDPTGIWIRFASVEGVEAARRRGNARARAGNLFTVTERRMKSRFRFIVAGAAMIATLLGPNLARAADIVDTAVAAGSFNTLVTAVKAAGLVGTLKGKGPYTVFAPNDAAFAKLPPGTVESLLKNKAKLATILKYHVVAGRVKSADVAGKTLKVATAAGLPVNVDGTFGVRVNDAHVIQPDIEASNGVIHVIDTVLIPPAKAKKAHH